MLFSNRQRLYWIAYAIVALAITSVMVLEDAFAGEYQDGLDLLFDLLGDLVLVGLQVVLIGYIGVRIIDQLDRLYNRGIFFSKRLLIELGIITVSSVALGGINTATSVLLEADHIDPEEQLEMLLFSQILLYFIGVSLIFLSIELINALSAKEHLVTYSDELRVKNIEAEYKALKNQINPHFLFNSFSVLSSLVYKDPDKADEFISEFSKVFRYVLELNNQTVVTLKRELDFLDSYFYMLKIRFGDHIHLEKRINAGALDTLIPPMATQLIIENAIKHNYIDQKHRLEIELLVEDDSLVIRNNILKRNDTAASTGQGLKNLIEKYNIISRRAPNFQIENGFYTAKLPLLAHETD